MTADMSHGSLTPLPGRGPESAPLPSPRAAPKVTTLARMVEAVLVTTDSTPPTSLASRDWISPVLVLVKKASDRVCRCD